MPCIIQIPSALGHVHIPSYVNEVVQNVIRPAEIPPESKLAYLHCLWPVGRYLHFHICTSGPTRTILLFAALF